MQKTAKITFMFIDLQSQYNAILGTTAQAALGIIAYVPHQRIKFNTLDGVAIIKTSPRSFSGHWRRRKNLRKVRPPDRKKRMELSGAKAKK